MDEGIPIAERMAQLREENEQLRQAAQAFGELAERLMQQLDAERRLHPPRCLTRAPERVTIGYSNRSPCPRHDQPSVERGRRPPHSET